MAVERPTAFALRRVPVQSLWKNVLASSHRFEPVAAQPGASRVLTLFFGLTHAQHRHLCCLHGTHAQVRDCGVQCVPCSHRSLVAGRRRAACSRDRPCASCFAKAPGTHRGGGSGLVLARAACAAARRLVHPLATVLSPRPPQFIRLLDHEPVEYNQEQCRVRTYDGREALIRSFPSKVGVRRFRSNNTHTPTRTHVRSGPSRRLEL